MEAGRKLDALIAEKVMGWQVKWTEVHQGGRSMGWFEVWVKKERSGWFKCPHFSYYIQDAWRLVSHMWDHGWTFATELFQDDGQYAAYFKNIRTRDRFVVRAVMAPHAICLAALKAFGNEDPE